MLINKLKKISSIVFISLTLTSVLNTPSLAVENTNRIADINHLEYPYKVDYLDLNIENQDLKMAYMDIKPVKNDNGKSVILFHGKNFNGFYWKKTIDFLANNGYRVIVPDQIGFGKSAKPNIHYSFHLLASNNKKLLDHLNIKSVNIIAHSMGGMLGTRFSLMYPDSVDKLILENPIGLEDYKTIVPYQDTISVYKDELKQNEESIRDYHKTYYKEWKAEYEPLVKILVQQNEIGDFPRTAMANALTYQMIYEQPVCYEFSNLKVNTLLVIGQLDRTVVGKSKVDKSIINQVGQYPELGKKTAKLIKNSQLLEIEGVGHIPHIEKTETFHNEIFKYLK